MTFTVNPSRKPSFWALVEGKEPKKKPAATPKPIKSKNAKPPRAKGGKPSKGKA